MRLPWRKVMPAPAMSIRQDWGIQPSKDWGDYATDVMWKMKGHHNEPLYGFVVGWGTHEDIKKFWKDIEDGGTAWGFPYRVDRSRRYMIKLAVRPEELDPK